MSRDKFAGQPAEELEIAAATLCLESASNITSPLSKSLQTISSIAFLN